VTAVAADASFDHRGLGHCYIILRTTRGSDLEEWRKRGDGGVCCVALWTGRAADTIILHLLFY
jgi:hypothetical protein